VRVCELPAEVILTHHNGEGAPSAYLRTQGGGAGCVPTHSHSDWRWVPSAYLRTRLGLRLLSRCCEGL